MYEIPKDDNIGRVTITRDYIEKTGGPIIEMRTSETPLIETSTKAPAQAAGNAN